MELRNNILPALVLSLLVVPLFAGPVDAVVGFTSTEQDAQIVGEYGAGAPYGQWIKRNEVTTFHLHSDCGGPITVDDCGSGTPPVFTLDTQLNANDPATVEFSANALFFGPIAVFDPPACSFGVLDDVRLFEFRSSILVTGDATADGAIEATVFATDAACANPVQIARFTLGETGAPSNGLPAGQRTISGSYVFPDPLGFNLRKGYHLRVQLQAVEAFSSGGNQLTPVTAMAMELDDPFVSSHFQVVSDSARLNFWTQNRFGVPTKFFPQAQPSTLAQDRQIFVRMVQFNPWGHDESCTGGSSTANPNVCPQDAIREQNMRLRVQDIDPAHQAPVYCGGTSFDPCYNGYLYLDQGLGLRDSDNPTSYTYIDCCNTNLPPSRASIEYVTCPATPPAVAGCPNPPSLGDRALGIARYHHTLRYSHDPRTLPDGQYQITFEDRNQGWIAAIPIFIGVGGFDFNYAAGENTELVNGVLTAAHTVGLREPTQYQFTIKNTGYQSNTYGFAAPTPGLGWTATVSPSQLTLAPGQVGEVEMMVFPSNSAVAGDFKIVSITATSHADNTAKVLYTKTTVTGTPSYGPISITTPVNLIEIRPQLTKVVPFVLRNGGTHQDAFVLTAQNLPPGWIAAFSPPYLQAFGASPEGFTLALKAPAEAPPGTSFNLVVKACRTANSAVCGQVSVPVTIVAIDGVDVRILEDVDASQAKTMKITWHDVVIDRRICNVIGVLQSCQNVNSDQGFDASAIYRLEVENTGDRADVITFTGSWQPNSPFGVTDNGNCDGSGYSTNPTRLWRDGVPDGWRYRILDMNPGGVGGAADPGLLTGPEDVDAPPRSDGIWSGVGPSRYTQDPAFTFGTAQIGVDARRSTVYSEAYSGELTIGRLSLPAHTKQYVYVELGWVQPAREIAGTRGTCDFQPPNENYRSGGTNPALGVPSLKAEFRLGHRSTNDQTIRGWTMLRAELTNRNTIVTQNGYMANPIFNVDLERGIYQPPTAYAPVSSTDGGIYNFYARNLGTEYDNLKISVDDGHNGWTHKIILAGGITPPVGPYLENVAGPQWNTRPAPHDVATRGCTLDSAAVTLICKAVGVREAVAFQVVAIPPANAPAGARDDMTVTVASMKGLDLSQNIFSRETVRTTVRGTYAFIVDNPDPVKVGYKTQTVAFPFSIRNIGQENDYYAISLMSGNQAWNPVFSTGDFAAVPAGYDLHGFLAVTVPNDADITRPGGPASPDAAPPEAFRVKIESMLVPGTASQLDLLVPTVPTPSFTITADPLTIPSGEMDRIRITGNNNGGNLEELRLDGHHRDFNNKLPALPNGWSFVCLPSTHANAITPSTCNADPAASCHAALTCNFPGRTQVPSPYITQLEVKAAKNQLGNSRVVQRIEGANVEAATGNVVETAYTDAIINLQSTYGVGLEEDENRVTRVIPPGNVASPDPSAVFKVKITNTGLTPQSVLLTNSNLPGSETADPSDDWTISYEAQQALVRPPGYQAPACLVNIACNVVAAQSDVVVEVAIHAPANAVPGQKAKIIIYGTVQEDTTQVASIELTAEVGKFDTGIIVSPATAYQAPGWSAPYVMRITNKGTVVDVTELTLNLPAQLKDSYRVKWVSGCSDVQPVDANDPASQERCIVQNISPGAGQTVIASVLVPDLAVATAEGQPGVPIMLRSRSNVAAVPTLQEAQLYLKVLDFVRADVDGDGVFEYAVNGCRVAQIDGCQPDASDGYERFQETEVDESPIHTVAVDVSQFLTAQARADYTVEGALKFKVDVNGDGFVDHFLDTNGDSLPDRVWSPAGTQRMFSGLPCSVDVTGDGLGELFVDFHNQLSPDGTYDFAYDMALGKSYRLLPVFVDAGDVQDYVVDLDADGLKGEGDPVVYGLQQVNALGQNVIGCSGVSKVEFRVDMDGDGDLDLVIGNGVGTPLYFLRNKGGDSGFESGAYIITLRDVTGDGTDDWTYDYKGNNGTPNAYYDPVRGESGLIDTQAEFVKDLQKYWYVGVLFALVVVLFVVLFMVTRK